MTKLVPSSEMVQTDMPIGSILVIDDTKAIALENKSRATTSPSQVMGRRGCGSPDRERDYLDQIQAQRLESDRLLLNILPKQIAERLKKGERTIADHFPDATVMFSDINDFTSLAARVRPDELVSMLSEVFSAFDVLADQYAMEKVKTVGDAYMVVAGVPQPRSDHANALARMALEMHETISEMRAPDGRRIHMRSGVHSGPVVGGVIGRTKFSYDLWGDTVNIAAKLRGVAPADTVLVSESTYERLRDSFTFGQAGQVSLKGRRRIATYYLLR